MQCSNWGLSSEVEQNNYLISFTRDILINVTQCRAFALFCHSVALLIHIQIISHRKSTRCLVNPCASTGYPSAANGSRRELWSGCWALYKKKRYALPLPNQTADFCTCMWLLFFQKIYSILNTSQLWVISDWCLRSIIPHHLSRLSSKNEYLPFSSAYIVSRRCKKKH